MLCSEVELCCLPCKTSSDPARGWRVLKRRVCAIAWLAKRSLSELHHSPTSQVSDARCQMRKRYSKKQHGGRQSRGLLITTKALADLGETSWFQERSQSALSKPRRWSCPKQPALALVEVHTCRCWQTAPCDCSRSLRAQGLAFFASFLLDSVWRRESRLWTEQEVRTEHNRKEKGRAQGNA